MSSLIDKESRRVSVFRGRARFCANRRKKEQNEEYARKLRLDIFPRQYMILIVFVVY
jgi:hypothetical protein